MERQPPDLPLGLAIVAHAVIVAAMIWNSAMAVPDDSARMDQLNQAESTIDIIMLADKLSSVVKAAASAIEHKPLPKAPEFRIPELSDGDLLAILTSSGLGDEDGMWAIPAVPQGRDTTPRELSLEEMADAPRLSAISRAPSLRNGEHVRAYLNQNFPEALRLAGGEVVVVVWLLIDTQGKVFKALVPQTSGRRDSDSVAVNASYLMEFEPAEQAGRALPVWVQQPVRFRVKDIY